MGATATDLVSPQGSIKFSDADSDSEMKLCEKFWGGNVGKSLFGGTADSLL